MILKTSTISAKDFLISASKKSTIFKERKEVLLRIAEGITTNCFKKGTLNISFISKNNARTSQICQVWGILSLKKLLTPY